MWRVHHGHDVAAERQHLTDACKRAARIVASPMVLARACGEQEGKIGRRPQERYVNQGECAADSVASTFMPRDERCVETVGGRRMRQREAVDTPLAVTRADDQRRLERFPVRQRHRLQTDVLQSESSKLVEAVILRPPVSNVAGPPHVLGRIGSRSSRRWRTHPGQTRRAPCSSHCLAEMCAGSDAAELLVNPAASAAHRARSVESNGKYSLYAKPTVGFALPWAGASPCTLVRIKDAA